LAIAGNSASGMAKNIAFMSIDLERDGDEGQHRPRLGHRLPDHQQPELAPAAQQARVDGHGARGASPDRRRAASRGATRSRGGRYLRFATQVRYLRVP
jgi:hypothetical protein